MRIFAVYDTYLVHNAKDIGNLDKAIFIPAGQEMVITGGSLEHGSLFRCEPDHIKGTQWMVLESRMMEWIPGIHPNNQFSDMKWQEKDYVFKDPEELHSVYDARMIIFHKWLYVNDLVDSQLLARVAFRLDQRWFRAMIWDEEK